jgi:hypothetical protein
MAAPAAGFELPPPAWDGLGASWTFTLAAGCALLALVLFQRAGAR